MHDILPSLHSCDANRVEKLQQRPCGLQHLKCLLPGPLRNVCWPHTLNDRACPAGGHRGRQEGRRGITLSREGRSLVRTASEKCVAFGSPSLPQPSRARPHPGLWGGVSGKVQAAPQWGSSRKWPREPSTAQDLPPKCMMNVATRGQQQWGEGRARSLPWVREREAPAARREGNRGCPQACGSGQRLCPRGPCPWGALRKPRRLAQPGGQWREQGDRSCSSSWAGELRQKAVQGEVVPFSVLPGPFL